MSVQPQTVINQEVRPEDRPRLTVDSVAAQWWQNLGGGIGVAILAALAAYWLGADWRILAAVTVTAGGVVFGLLMAVRSVIDEVMDYDEWRRLHADIEQANADAAAWTEDAAAYESQIEELRRENASLRYRLEHGGGRNYVSATPEPTEGAEDGPGIGADVRKMIEVAYSGGAPVHPGKETMKAWGWTETRQAAAYDALRNAGVVTGHRNRPQWPATKSQAYALLMGQGAQNE